MSWWQRTSICLYRACLCGNLVIVFSLVTFFLPIMIFHVSLLTSRKCLKSNVSPGFGWLNLTCISQPLPHLGAKLVVLGELLALLLKQCQRKLRWYLTLYVKACCYGSCQKMRHIFCLLWPYGIFVFFRHFLNMGFKSTSPVLMRCSKYHTVGSCDKHQAFPLTNKAVRKRSRGSSFVLRSADGDLLCSTQLRSKWGSQRQQSEMGARSWEVGPALCSSDVHVFPSNFPPSLWSKDQGS